MILPLGEINLYSGFLFVIKQKILQNCFYSYFSLLLFFLIFTSIVPLKDLKFFDYYYQSGLENKNKYI